MNLSLFTGGANFFDPFFWLFFGYFFIALFIAFYIPGSLVLRKFSLTFFQKCILGTTIGMVLWGWQATLFGYANLRNLSYVYLSTMFLFWITHILQKKNKPKLKITGKKYDWIIIGIIILGSLVQLLTVWFTGASFSNGNFSCCGNESDSFFYASLTKQLIANIPPFQPGMCSTVVHNYHYWSNLVLADLIRVFNLPLLATQLQYAMVFLSLFFGLTVVVFGQIINAKKIFIAWLLFFLYFGGDLMYLILYFYGTGINFSVSGLESGAGFLINSPRAFSLIIFFAGVSMLLLWLKRKDIFSGCVMALLLGTVIGFKVYTGLFALMGLASLGVYFLIRKQWKMIVPLVLALVISILVYLPVNQGSGGLYFTGLWRFENFRTITEFRLERLEYAKLLYYQHNNLPRIVQYEVFFALLYFVAMFGSKLIGLLQTKKSLSLFPRELHIFLIPALFISLILGSFFQQTSGGANTFNFLVSVFIIGSLYTALTITVLIERLSKKWLVIPFVCLVIAGTIPRVVYESLFSIQRLTAHKGFIMTNDELAAYAYIRNNTEKDALILVDERRFALAKTSPYVSIFVDRPIFLSGKGILESHGIDISSRTIVQQKILTNKDPFVVQRLLEKNGIDYILLSEKDHLMVEPYVAQVVFNNKKVKILKVR